jgi:hypothetical protein
VTAVSAGPPVVGPPALGAPAASPYPVVAQGQPPWPLSQPEQPSALRGLLVHSVEPLPPELFVPYMLGDFSRVSIPLASDIKIAEGESPRPLDRVYYNFYYYNNVDKMVFSNPAEPVHGVDLYNHVFGLEKTFFDGLVSLGLRVPFHTLDAQAKEFTATPFLPGVSSVVGPGGPGFTDTQFGNISVVAKVLLLEDRSTGSLISAGTVVTFPTGSSEDVLTGSSFFTFVQPFGAFIWKRGDFFVQGFISAALPISREQAVVLFNDLGVGYFAYRDAGCSRWLRAVVPTLELHINTPLRQPEVVEQFEGLDSLRLVDTVDLTLGTTLEFGDRATLGLGMITPLTGPRPFDIGALAQLNYRF